MRHAVPILAVLLVAACTDDLPNECGTDGPGVAAPVSAEIGPAGGRLAVTAGPLACTTLEIERGELMETHRFTISATSDLTMDVGEFSAEPAGPAVRIRMEPFAEPMFPPRLRYTIPFHPAPGDPEELLLFDGGSLPNWLADGFTLDLERGRATFYSSYGGTYQVGRRNAECPAPLTACRYECQDLRTDPHNCGVCARSCGFHPGEFREIGTSCVAGVCEDWAGERIARIDPACGVTLGTEHLFFERDGRLLAVTKDGSETLDLGSWPAGDCPTFLEHGDDVFVTRRTAYEGWVERYPLGEGAGTAYRVTPPGTHGPVNGLAILGDRLFASHGEEGSVLLELDPVGAGEGTTVRESAGRMQGPVATFTGLFVHEVDASGSGPLLRIRPDGWTGPTLAALEGTPTFFAHGGDLYFVSGETPCTAEAPRRLQRIPAGADVPDLALDVGCTPGPILVDDAHVYFPAERDGVYAGLLRRPLAGGDATFVEGSGPITFVGVDEAWLYGTRPDDGEPAVVVRLPK